MAASIKSSILASRIIENCSTLSFVNTGTSTDSSLYTNSTPQWMSISGWKMSSTTSSPPSPDMTSSTSALPKPKTKNPPCSWSWIIRKLHCITAELGARTRVRKRKMSFGTRTEEETKAWDTFMSLSATAKKLGINFYSYLYDRISGVFNIPNLADIISQRAKKLNLAASWDSSP